MSSWPPAASIPGASPQGVGVARAPRGGSSGTPRASSAQLCNMGVNTHIYGQKREFNLKDFYSTCPVMIRVSVCKNLSQLNGLHVVTNLAVEIQKQQAAHVIHESMI